MNKKVEDNIQTILKKTNDCCVQGLNGVKKKKDLDVGDSFQCY